MPATWNVIELTLTQRDFSIDAAYLLSAVAGLAYMDGITDPRDIATVFGAQSARFLSSTGVFAPAMLLIESNGSVIVGIEGTRNFEQWVSYVVGAGIAPIGLGKGSVFAPFLASYAKSLVQLLAVLNPSSPVWIAGHSLGAAVGAMVSQELLTRGYNVRTCYQFAMPKFADSAYRMAYRVPLWVVNHPMDPVPLMPPDPVTALNRQPLGIQWAGTLGPVGDAVPIYRSIPGPFATLRANLIAGMATANMGLRENPHNMYRYLREVANVTSKESLVYYRDITELLRANGLYDPWP